MSFDPRLCHFYYEIFIGILSYLLTFLVIYLAIYKMNRIMKEYRLIIVLSCFVELFYNTATMISMPVAEISGGKLFMMNSGHFEHIEQPYSLLILIFWLFTMYVLIVNTTMLFVYRYRILCLKHGFTMRKFAYLYILMIAVVGFHTSACYWTAERFSNSNTNDEYLKILQSNSLWLKDTPNGIVFDAMRLKSFIQLANTQIIMFSCYTIIGYSGWKVHKCLIISRRHMSTTTINVQTQLTKIMVLQALYPLLDTIIPVVLCCIAPMFNLTIPFIGIFIGATMSLIPIVNSLVIIWVIPSFRRATLQLLCLKKFDMKIESQAASSINQKGPITEWRRRQIIAQNQASRSFDPRSGVI